MISQPNTAIVIDQIKAHVELMHSLAAPYAGKGKLICASFGQDPVTGDNLKPVVKHFQIGDSQGMATWIIKHTQQQHRNVYIPLAVFRPDLPIGKKGTEKDIVAMLGFIADFDDADAANYAGRLPSPFPPDYVLETSAGRFQAFYLFKEPIPVVEPADFSKIKQVAEQLKAYARCDHGTADLSHVWRVGGSLNWPNKKKVDADRPATPQNVKICEPYIGSQTDFTALKSALANVTPADTVNLVSPPLPDNQNFSIADAMCFLPPELQKIITSPPAPDEDRSKTIFNVVAWLSKLSYGAQNIEAIILAHPEGIGEKYADRNDLGKEIERILGKIYSVYARIRKSFGLMTRKLSVTESQY